MQLSVLQNVSGRRARNLRSSNRRSTYSSINDSAEMICRKIRSSGRVMECERNGMLWRSALRYVAFRMVPMNSDGTYISNVLDRVTPELHSHLPNHRIGDCVLDRSQFYLRCFSLSVRVHWLLVSPCVYTGDMTGADAASSTQGPRSIRNSAARTIV